MFSFGKLFGLTLLCMVSSESTWMGKIKHIIVLMLENRSFDHMLGLMKETNSNINGCLPTDGPQCGNPINISDANSELFYINSDGYYIQPGDPDHSCTGTAFEEYGVSYDTLPDYYPAPMNGFIHQYNNRDKNGHNGSEIMNSFSPDAVPIITTLASEFGMVNEWFADVPGPTEPNRLFAMMGTSKGMAHNDDIRLVIGVPGNNIFKMIDEYTNNEWAVYTADGPSAAFVEYTREHPMRYHDLPKLYKDINAGELPFFSWVEPAYFTISKEFQASDQHPNHDVRKGEELMKNIYETLRNSSIWEDSLFVIYYDEHGGFFDHVSPPNNCPNPDGINSTDVEPPFNFQRLGLRVPSIFVSPWIKKGTIVSNTNHTDNQYTSTSLIHTIREQYAPNSPGITKRESWSKTVEGIVNLDEMRTDCPVTLPDIPYDNNDRIHPNWDVNKGYGNDEPNDLQINIAKAVANMCRKDKEVYNYMDNEGKLGMFVRECMQKWREQAL